MQWQSLTKEHTLLLKGAAIFMIVTHNFMHLLPGPSQMEFFFRDGLFNQLLSLLASEPEKWLQYFSSYFGHFGVQIFIFISAYGLTKKYLTQEPKYFYFIKTRFLSIYPTFLLAILLFSIVSASLTYGVLGFAKIIFWELDSFLYKIFLISNFFESERLNLVGPWWFISFIFQFYFIFPILFFLYRRFNNSFLILAISFYALIMIITDGQIGNVTLTFTVIGHLPELILGMYMAKRDKAPIDIPPVSIPILICIYLIGNYNPIVWYFSASSFLLLMLIVAQIAIQSHFSISFIKNSFLFLGVISMPLFFINGFLREPFIRWAKVDDIWISNLGYCLISLTLSIVIAFLMFKFESMVRKVFSK